MKIFQVYPFLSVIAGTKGISSSEAQRIKEENKNEAGFLMQDLEVKEDRLYSTKREILSGTGVNTNITDCANPHTVADFDCLEKVQDLFAVSAVLGAGLKLLESVRDELSKMSVQALAEKLGLERTFTQPQLKSCLKNKSINSFCNEEKIEDLLQYADTELVTATISLFKKGLPIEARAAVLGNQYTKTEKLIRKVSTLSDKQLPDKEPGGMLVCTYKIVAVDKTAFKEYEKTLAANYTKLQQERNSIMKQIKDAARELEVENMKEYQAQLNQFNADQKEFVAMIEKVRLELLQEAASLKILA